MVIPFGGNREGIVMANYKFQTTNHKQITIPKLQTFLIKRF